MKTIGVLVLVVLLHLEISGQISNPIRFPYQEYDTSFPYSSVLELPNGDLFFFYNKGTSFLRTRSTDGGLTWSNPVFFDSIYFNYPTDNIASTILDSGKIAIIYRAMHPDQYSIRFSYDDGLTWLSPISLPVGTNAITRSISTAFNITQHINGEVYISYSKRHPVQGLYFIKSTNNGYTWSAEQSISNLSSTSNGVLFPISSQILMLIYEFEQNGISNIYSMKTTNNGTTWLAPVPLTNTQLNEKRPRILRDNDNTIWLFYELEKETPFAGFFQSDIVFQKSTNNGNTWTAPVTFTQYRGNDFNCEVTLSNDKPFISFSSSRDFQIGREKFQLYYGIAGETIDNNAPPYMHYSEHIPDIPEPFQPVAIRCYADDESGISTVKVLTTKNAAKTDTLQMFDDGLHGDSLANDGIYGIILNDMNTGDIRTYSFLITDVNDNTVHLNGGIIIIPLDFKRVVFTLETNKIKLSINNWGVIANVRDTSSGITGGFFEDIQFLFCGGFFLSGYSNGTLWANAVASASLISDYLPGRVGAHPSDPKNNIYVVKSTDQPFGQSWQEWRYAVLLGADFYDGDGDGIYNPIDLNGNGIWDLNEDRPDLLGDVTVWCIYNDGVPNDGRRYNTVHPQGIEIQQTAFALGPHYTGITQNILFFRYRLLNRGTVASVLDAVIFGLWTDPDIGQAYMEDIVGVDTLSNAAFVYKKFPDPAYGQRPPALITSILQGPLAYIPGETFIDVNGNGVYDPGIDTPIDTAYHHNGLYIGTDIFPGARNLDISSFVHFANGFSPAYSDPRSPLEARHSMLGRDKLGDLPNPCTWPLGNVVGNVNCNDVNPVFWYSGDPERNEGWINTQPWDQRMMLNAGPFQLKENEPIDIWVAYVLGKGASPLNSITAAKDINQLAIGYYKSNFSFFPLDMDDDTYLLTDFKLYQNYPNPFNPTTTISWQSPVHGRQTLKVFDILGREVATLVDEERPAGRYEILFDASHLASGVYFYQLRTDNFIQTKKMVLLK